VAVESKALWIVEGLITATDLTIESTVLETKFAGSAIHNASGDLVTSAQGRYSASPLHQMRLLLALLG
jgi:hypothetical protein